MASKLLKLALAAALALSIVGCGDDNDNDTVIVVDAKVGGACNATERTKACVGQDVLKCDSESNTWVAYENCKDKDDYPTGDYTCVNSPKSAACVSSNSACDKKGKTKYDCGYMFFLGTITVSYSCQTGADKKHYWVQDDVDLCDEGDGYCNADNTCHASESCDASAPETCVDDFISYCIKYTTGETFKQTLNCKNSGLSCVSIDGVYNCYDFCSAADENKVMEQKCEIYDGYGLETVSTCVKADGGKYVLNVEEKDCANMCATDGKTCDAEGYYSFDDEEEEEE